MHCKSTQLPLLQLLEHLDSNTKCDCPKEDPGIIIAKTCYLLQLKNKNTHVA